MGFYRVSLGLMLLGLYLSPTSHGKHIHTTLLYSIWHNKRFIVKTFKEILVWTCLPHVYFIHNMEGNFWLTVAAEIEVFRSENVCPAKGSQNSLSDCCTVHVDAAGFAVLSGPKQGVILLLTLC